jgi:membrane protease YdiL (CAAX protease family)
MSLATVQGAAWRRQLPLSLLAWCVVCAAGALLLPLGAASRSLLLAPLLEEIVFRRGLQDALVAHRRPALSAWAPWLTAALFAIAHIALVPDAADLPRAAATFVPALLIGLTYRRGGALAPCIALHAAFNLAWLAGIGSLSA